MRSQGLVFRNRYLRPAHHDEHVGIAGIEPETVDNSQLVIEASTDRCSSASAIAFMQGLYPPWPHDTCSFDSPGHSRVANSSIPNYPLCGYQFPNIRTISPINDPDSIWYRLVSHYCRDAPLTHLKLQEQWSSALHQA